MKARERAFDDMCAGGQTGLCRTGTFSLESQKKENSMDKDQGKGFVLVKKGEQVENAGPVFPVETPKVNPNGAKSDGKYPAKHGYAKGSTKKSK
jgi:hypothetical protein